MTNGDVAALERAMDEARDEEAAEECGSKDRLRYQGRFLNNEAKAGWRVKGYRTR